jgi:hypothetical protein
MLFSTYGTGWEAVGREGESRGRQAPACCTANRGLVMPFCKLLFSALVGLALTSTADADAWSNGSSRGFEYHIFGTDVEGFNLVCDSDSERDGSFLEVRANGLEGDAKYKVQFGSTSFTVAPLFPSDKHLTILAKRLSDQDKKELLDAYASSSMLRVFKGDRQLLELDLGMNRPDLCF